MNVRWPETQEIVTRVRRELSGDERIVNWRIKIKRDITIAQKKHTGSLHSSLVLYPFPVLSLCFCFEHCARCALLFAGIYFACNLPALNVSVVWFTARVTVDESLPGPWNTYLRGKSIKGRTGGGKRKRETGGLRVQFPRWRRNGMGNSGERGARRKGGECWTRWRRASDCACMGHTRKVDPHNDLVTNCLHRKYYRREPWATRERKNAGPITCRALSPRFLGELMREEVDFERNIFFSLYEKVKIFVSDNITRRVLSIVIIIILNFRFGRNVCIFTFTCNIKIRLPDFNYVRT